MNDDGRFVSGPLRVLVGLLAVLALVTSPTAASSQTTAGTGSITGAVTDAVTGAPIDGASVQAFGEQTLTVGSATTGSDGTYQIIGLPTDNYHVFFDGSTAGDYGGLDHPGVVSVTDGLVTGGIDAALDHVVRPTGSIRGTVTDAVTGAPVGGVSVNVSGTIGFGSAVTEPDGTYEVTGLATDSYTVDFFDPGGIYAEELYDGVPFTQNYGGPIQWVAVIDGRATEGVDATLELVGWFEGRITNAFTGRPLADVCVNLADPSGLAGVGTTTDSSGRYRIRANLTTYTLAVNVQFEGCGFGGESHKVNYGQAHAGPFPVAAGQVRTVNVRLTPKTPQSPADCKQGGWRSVYQRDGSAFKNQGDCVSSLRSKHSR